MSNSNHASLQLLAIFILFLYLLQPTSAHNKSHPDEKMEHKSGTSTSSSSGGGGSSSGDIQMKVSLKGSFSQVLAFGDSYTDTGNCMFLNGLKMFFGGKIPHSPYGALFKNPLSGNRFCDGRLVVDFLCAALGLPPLPPFKDPQVNVTFGVNFAVSGSTSLTSDLFSKYKIGQGLLWKSMVPQNFLTQLEWFDEFLEKMASSGQGGYSGSGSGGASGKVSGGGSLSGQIGGGGQVGGVASGSSSGSSQSGGSASGTGSGQIGGSGQVSGSGQIGGGGSEQAGGTATGSGQVGVSGSGQASGSSSGSGQIGGGGSGQAGGTATGSGQVVVSGSGQASGSSSGSGQISGSASGKASGSASIDLSNILFWIGEMGVNDYARIISTTNLSGNWLSQMSVNNVIKILKGILEKGGKYVVVQGLPPLGCLPLPLAFTPESDRDKNGCSETINSLIKFHNQLLQKKIAELQAENEDCVISYADYYSAYITIMTNATAYQVQEPLKACCGAQSGPFNFSPKFLCGVGSTNKCSDPSKYIVWDGLHLTEAMHKHLADLFFNKGYCHPSIHEMIAKKTKCS